VCDLRSKQTIETSVRLIIEKRRESNTYSKKQERPALTQEWSRYLCKLHNMDNCITKRLNVPSDTSVNLCSCNRIFNVSYQKPLHIFIFSFYRFPTCGQIVLCVLKSGAINENVWVSAVKPMKWQYCLIHQLRYIGIRNSGSTIFYVLFRARSYCTHNTGNLNGIFAYLFSSVTHAVLFSRQGLNAVICGVERKVILYRISGNCVWTLW
jgi:hypothetical protein